MTIVRARRQHGVNLITAIFVCSEACTNKIRMLNSPVKNATTNSITPRAGAGRQGMATMPITLPAAARCWPLVGAALLY